MSLLPDLQRMTSDDWTVLGNRVVLVIVAGAMLAVACGWLKW